jgi:putative transposase
MAHYLRPRIPAATVFFTVCLAEPGSRLLVEEIDILRDAVRVTRARRPFVIDAWVVLPDHMHAVWTLPEGDTNYSDRWGAIKARFSRFVRLKAADRLDDPGGAVGCKPTLQTTGTDLRRVGFQPTEPGRLRARRSPSKVAKQDAGIWQRRFWEHHIRSEADFKAHMHFCWMNPVKHGLVTRPVDWAYSSIHRDIRAGRVDPYFAVSIVQGDFGEVA